MDWVLTTLMGLLRFGRNTHETFDNLIEVPVEELGVPQPRALCSQTLAEAGYQLCPPAACSQASEAAYQPCPPTVGQRALCPLTRLPRNRGRGLPRTGPTNSLFLGDAQRLFPSGDAILQGRNITPEIYQEIRDLGGVGVIEPRPAIRGPDIIDNGSVWWISYGERI